MHQVAAIDATPSAVAAGCCAEGKRHMRTYGEPWKSTLSPCAHGAGAGVNKATQQDKGRADLCEESNSNDCCGQWNKGSNGA